MRTDPEPLLRKLLETEGGRLPVDSLKWAVDFVEHGECGLAYDSFVYHTTVGSTELSPAGMELLRDAGDAMGVKYPQYVERTCSSTGQPE